MEKHARGTLINGVVQLDGEVDIPNNSRVEVTLRATTSVEDEERLQRQEALGRLLKRAAERRFHSGGLRFTRDQLHERN
ncbi:hypothetical protein [Fuerstiella marisgermanici]|uniref:Uncharacterized protein n=1 Tax=Fuerstiella marisgermanici TaxID=1891926 RepID=A0A1P8WM93_9PLAN|nr:hypothetical protein [Fuerstiella marisgermanici]APZ95170.1 hypothetical protein Fuma_04825 [Fuerstiella marisgermanici]